MTSSTTETAAPDSPTVAAGALPPWQVADLPPPPLAGWRLWIGLLGPGIVLAGTSIGSGEWLFGPAVTAQYGATLLWLASISIILQVFCNLMMMRYAVYCGEPIIVGGLRTMPGPALWITCYAIMDIAAIWPFNASNAAVPLVAMILGRLPDNRDEILVKSVGYAIFLLSFVPLIFGGTVYRMLEKVMTFKLVYVLGYLSLVVVLMVSPMVMWEVVRGFGEFGTVPIRADSVVAGPHFNILDEDGEATYRIRGTVERGQATIAEFRVQRGKEAQSFKMNSKLTPALKEKRDALLARALKLAQPNRFFVETRADEVRLAAEGTIVNHHVWQAQSLTVDDGKGSRPYDSVAQVPSPYAKRFSNLLDNQGLEKVGLIGYTTQHGKLPPLDWATLAAFCAIAGAGALSNTLFSNYARDKGWGMGVHVGAIPSAIGGRLITLSHVGKVFPLDDANRKRWLGWMRHIQRDQFIWMLASFLGMALPCMLSLEFIRNATVEGNRVAAMSAEGMAQRYPAYSQLLWMLTLFCGFIVLAPGQVSVGDQIARRWTDIIWASSRRARLFAGDQVKYLYYGILAIYAVWGVITLGLFNPLQIAKIGAVLGNVALAFSSVHALYANRTLLPREFRPHWFLQVGVVACALFFLGITGVVLYYM